MSSDTRCLLSSVNSRQISMPSRASPSMEFRRSDSKLLDFNFWIRIFIESLPVSAKEASKEWLDLELVKSLCSFWRCFRASNRLFLLSAIISSWLKELFNTKSWTVAWVCSLSLVVVGSFSVIEVALTSEMVCSLSTFSGLLGFGSSKSILSWMEAMVSSSY